MEQIQELNIFKLLWRRMTVVMGSGTATISAVFFRSKGIPYIKSLALCMVWSTVESLSTEQEQRYFVSAFVLIGTQFISGIFK